MFRKFLVVALVAFVPDLASAQANAAAVAKQLEANERAVKGSMMGQAMPSPVWASTTYANRGGKWVAVSHQETLLTPPPPAARK